MIQGPAVHHLFDCTAHIRPYLSMCHNWLIKVNAKMPAIHQAPQLQASVENRLNPDILKANEESQQTSIASIT